MDNTMQAKPHKMLPTFSLNEDDLPEIKDWKVGGEYEIFLRVKQTSLDSGLGMPMMEGESKKLSERFQVIEARAVEGKEDEEQTDEGDLEQPTDNKTAVVAQAFKRKIDKEY